MKSPDKQQATPEERELKRVSIQQYNDYVARYRPAEAALAKKAELTDGERAQVRGEASADTAAAFKGMTRDTIAAAGISGADANSGKTKFSLAGNAEARGRASGLSQAAAITGAEIDSDQQQVGITAIGRGVASDATANLSRGARRATSLALAEASARHQTNMARVGAVASISGGLARKFGPDLFGEKSLEDGMAKQAKKKFTGDISMGDIQDNMYVGSNNFRNA